MLESAIQASVKAIRQRGAFNAEIALVLGSGLGNFVDSLTSTTRIPFANIPGFPVSTVEGHSGELVHGFLGDIPVLVNSGRVHFYEGYSLEQVIYPIQILQALGAKTIILTNAAGSIRKAYSPGDLMLITRFINQTGRSVYGEAAEPENIFNTELSGRIVSIASQASIQLKTGSYAGLNGPSYETPAEIRFLRLKNADAVGMSTVHEAVYASTLGMEVGAISCITNYAAGISPNKLSHNEVMGTAELVKEKFERLVKKIVEMI